MSARGASAALIDTAPPFTITPVFYAYQNQADVRAAANDDGFLVVWQSRPNLESGSTISAFRLDVDGKPVGTEFLVSSPEATVDASSPSVEAFADGSFLVGWVERGVEQAVHVRRFASDASPLGTEITAAGPTTDLFDNADVATAGGGTFIVVWRGPGKLLAKRYAADATELPGVAEPTVGGSGQIGKFDVSGGADGSFVVVWSEGYTYQTGAAGDYRMFTRWDGHGRTIDADGNLGGTRFFVGGDNEFNVRHLDDAGFVVVWSSVDGSYDVPSQPSDVFVVAKNADGSSRGESLQINERKGDEQDGPAISAARASAGGFVVAWQHSAWYGGAVPAAVFARALDSGGNIDGTPVPLAPAVPADVTIVPTVAAANGIALIAWQLGDEIQGQLVHEVDEVRCGDASFDGRITARDALLTLIAAVGSRYCSRLLCDADASGTVNATDALVILRAAIGASAALTCA